MRPPKKQVRHDCIWTVREQVEIYDLTPAVCRGCFFLRLAPGRAGPDGPLSGLLCRLLFGLPGSTLHHVQGWTLLLHWAVSDLRR